jgi:hypothetical protein
MDARECKAIIIERSECSEAEMQFLTANKSWGNAGTRFSVGTVLAAGTRLMMEQMGQAKQNCFSSDYKINFKLVSV